MTIYRRYIYIYIYWMKWSVDVNTVNTFYWFVSCCARDLRFRMFLLSSSSTAGLWLSLLRKKTRITFCTIFTIFSHSQHCLSSDQKRVKDGNPRRSAHPETFPLKVRRISIHTGEKHSSVCIISLVSLQSSCSALGTKILNGIQRRRKMKKALERV